MVFSDIPIFSLFPKFFQLCLFFIFSVPGIICLGKHIFLKFSLIIYLTEMGLKFFNSGAHFLKFENKVEKQQHCYYNNATPSWNAKTTVNSRQNLITVRCWNAGSNTTISWFFSLLNHTLSIFMLYHTHFPLSFSMLVAGIMI